MLEAWKTALPFRTTEQDEFKQVNCKEVIIISPLSHYSVKII